jgi:S-adenosylmethionine/arginine decarboxylase-like enzyme
MSNKSLHIVADYSWNENPDLTNEEFHNILFVEIEKIINNTKLVIVHKNLCLLPMGNHISEIGGTLFYQLDSSHFSLHSFYGESKIIAMDLFSCGETDIVEVMTKIDAVIRKIIPDIRLTFRYTLPRFNKY